MLSRSELGKLAALLPIKGVDSERHSAPLSASSLALVLGGFMERTCVLVADRLRARLFTLEPVQNLHHRYELNEKVDLVNRYPQISSQNRQAGSALDTQTRHSRSVAFTHDQRHQDQDHDDRKFAREVIQELVGYLKSDHADQLLLVAPPQFLGALREHKQTLRSEVGDIQDVAKELTHLTIPEIRNYLEQKILL